MQNNHVRYLYVEVNCVFVREMREYASSVSCCAPGRFVIPPVMTTKLLFTCISYHADLSAISD